MWSAVSNPATGGLYGVTALASNNVWAVGGSQVPHWNGTRWSIVPSPQPQSDDHRLFQKLDAHAIAAALGAHFVGSALPTGRGSQGQALLL